MVLGAITRIVPKVFTYGKAAAKAAPSIIFGNGSTTFVNAANTALKTSTSAGLGGSLWNAVKAGGKAVNASTAASGGLWKTITGTVSKAGAGALKGWSVGGRAAKIAAASGKAGFMTKLAAKVPLLGKLGGAFKGISKAMPGIGNIAVAAMSIPTIVSAFKDEGLWGGVKEVAKEGTKLGAGAIGGAIGSAFGPIGTAVGWLAGTFIGGLFTGKSHSEKKAEEEAQLAEMQQQQQQGYVEPQGTGFNPNAIDPSYAYNNTINPYYNPYSDDILYQRYKQQMGFQTIA